MRRGLHAAAAVAIALTAAAAASAGADARYTLRGTVSQVVDGDTLEVVLAGGKRDRVRLVGVDAAERGACFAAEAAAHVRRLAQSIARAARRPKRRQAACVRAPRRPGAASGASPQTRSRFTSSL